MSTHTLEEVPCSSVVYRQEQPVEYTDFARVAAMQPATAAPPGRRREARVEHQSLCSYEVLEAVEEESVVIEKGEAYALNRSKEGIRLIMRQAPHAKQIIEVNTARARWGRTVNVYEVRWTAPVQVESLGTLYLVGCRRVFGPCNYVSF